jgi:hypothetical protein
LGVDNIKLVKVSAVREALDMVLYDISRVWRLGNNLVMSGRRGSLNLVGVVASGEDRETVVESEKLQPSKLSSSKRGRSA